VTRNIFPHLRSFIDELRRRGDVAIVNAPVSAKLEIAEIHRRVIAADGPALLFTNVEGSSFPVVTNLFGTMDRVNLAFGNRPKEFVKQVARLPEELLPPSVGKLWNMRHVAKQGLRIGFRTTRRPAVRECALEDNNLNRLPALTSWSEDGGPFLTLPLVHSKSVTGKPDNLGMYRIQIHDSHETGIHFQIGKGGGFHLKEAEALNQPLPVNIYLGGPPSLILSAIAPLPENVPELMLASMVSGNRLPRGKTGSNGISPIAEAEFCLEGVVPPHVRRPEGPFGDHYGYYSLQHDYPVFRPTKVWHRKNAIFPATVVGKPRQEDFYIGDYLQELLLPLIPLVMSGVQDLWSYGETGFHSLSSAVLKERYGREAMASVFRIFGEGQLSLTKFLLGVDRPMDLRNFPQVLTYVLERMDPRKDLYIFGELSMDTLDYAGPEVNKGSKGALIGIGEPKRTLPRERPNIQNRLIKAMSVFCPGCLVVQTESYASHKDAPAEIAKIEELKDWPLIAVVDDAQKTASSSINFLWSTFTRFEPARDIHAKNRTVIHNHIAYDGPIVIDSRMKPWYPAELFCDPETRSLVNRRWKEYFPNHVEMGSSDEAHLT